MKNIFIITIFLLFALPVSAEETGIFLTNQGGARTTQFGVSDEVYVEGTCLPATQEIVKAFIAYHKTWEENDKLSDVSGGIESFAGSGDGRVNRILIWGRPIVGTYDVLMDTNNDYILQGYEKQCIISGFQVGTPAPAPAPTPAPAPAPETAPAPLSSASSPAPKPSTSFSLDEQIETKGFSNVRKSAGGTMVGNQIGGTLGVVVGGPVQASVDGKKFWFWNIDFESDPDGWVSETNIKTVSAGQSPLDGAPASVATTTPTTTPETAMATASPDEETDIAEEMPAQAITGLSSFGNSIIIGAALFLGLIFGSIIIGWALQRRN